MKRTSEPSPFVSDLAASSTGAGAGAEFASLRTDNPVPGTVHVVDDDPAVRDSLVFLLETAGFTARAHASAEALLDAAPTLAPGCVLTDIHMPGLDGLGLQRRLAELGLHVAVVVMTGQADVPSAVAAMKAGAVDFLQKPFEAPTLLAVIRQALTRQRERDATEAAAEAAAARLAGLTRREREVADQLVAGHSNKVIAQALGASPRTIEVHRARVMEKLGVRSLPELVRLVMARG
ncbi:MAG: response regulator transcription factor [Rhodospirillales bacterium]|nr:response regulator transcription factor [Rhodospirillales bacterium]